MKGKVIAIIVVVILVLIGLISNANESERNKVGSSIDWGDGYYWNSSTESVERTIWD